MSVSFIKWLDQLRKTDKNLVGGKAANLGEMILAGIPCPSGFCITVATFSHFLQQSDIDGLLKKAKALSDSGIRNQRFTELVATAKQRIKTADISDEIISAVEHAYHLLSTARGRPNTLVALRSSAVSEDLREASFAGQFDTFLGIRGSKAVLDSMRDCWASLLNQHAMDYAQAKGYDVLSALMGVIVQEAVIAEKSGVLFTVHPVSGDFCQTAIEATWGLGQTLVSGSVNPDTYIVDRASYRILDRHIPRKQYGAFMDTKSGQGIRVQEIPLRKQDADCLSRDEVRSLVELGKKLETIFGCPQDIEWAIDDTGQLFILQARPITTGFV